METVATLVFGLRDNSRIKLKISNLPVSAETLLLASAVDRLSVLIWLNSEDGRKGVNRPISIVDKLTCKEKESEFITFESGEAFEEYRRRLFEGV